MILFFPLLRALHRHDAMAGRAACSARLSVGYGECHAGVRHNTACSTAQRAAARATQESLADGLQFVQAAADAARCPCARLHSQVLKGALRVMGVGGLEALPPLWTRSAAARDSAARARAGMFR